MECIFAYNECIPGCNERVLVTNMCMFVECVLVCMF